MKPHELIVLKGDEVKLKSGQTGIVIDTWGVARDWCKVKTADDKIVLCMTDQIESIIKRDKDKRRKWR